MSVRGYLRRVIGNVSLHGDVARMNFNRPSNLFSFFLASCLMSIPALLTAKPASAVQTGFYRVNNRDRVYLVFQTDAMYCWIQTDSVMDAYDKALAAEGGARGKVQNTYIGFLDRLQNTGLCTLPKGFYRRENEPVVYQLSGEASPRFQTGTRYCQVTTEEKMRQFGGSQQVQVVSTATNITTGRTSTGACTEKW